MFTVNCPGHRARVLLGPRSIERLVDTDDGIAIEWRCHCGSRGVVGRDGSTPVARVEQAACA
jgi:hypothetical protein